MASLLSLPVEVRASIIDLVVFSHREPPHPSMLPKDRRPKDFESRSWDTLASIAGYGHDLYHHDANSSGLLLTNHQLCSETQHRLSREARCHELRVVLFNEEYLAPTWTLIPSVSAHVDRLTATFYPYGDPQSGRSIFRGGDGSPPMIEWQLYSLLERFLYRGPSPFSQSPQSNRGLHRRYSITQLDINVITPPVLAPGCQLREYAAYNYETRDVHEMRGRHRNGKETDGFTMAPEYLAEHIISALKTILCMSYHTAWYGGILFDAIGTITVSINGELQHKSDLGEILADFPLNGPDETFRKQRQANFEEWRRYALRKRKQRGLPYRLPETQAEGDGEDDLSVQRYPG